MIPAEVDNEICAAGIDTAEPQTGRSTGLIVRASSEGLGPSGARSDVG
jgi:hypothetical protein